ncbi:MAG TPA: SDR family oxidoreductase [Bacilli bacterium]
MSARTVLITGALGDIGRAMANSLAGAGMNLALNDVLDVSLGQKAVQSFKEKGVKANYYPCDITDYKAVEKMVESIVNDFGHLDICICNAAVVLAGRLVEITQEQWDKHMDVNLSGTFYVAQHSAKSMIKTNIQGQLIFISSWVQDVPHITTVPYAVTKSGVNLLMKGFAKELATHGIRANSVAPGIVNAGLSKQIMLENPKFEKELLRKIPLGRLQTPDHVADAVLFLCSREAEYMTGSVLQMDGGTSLFYDSEEA